MGDKKSILPHLSAMTKAIWNSLTPREKEVLENRFGINGPKPPGVEEIERKFLRKLKKVIEKRHPETWKNKGEEEEEK